MANELKYRSVPGLGIVESWAGGISMFFGSAADKTAIFAEVEANGGAAVGSLYIGSTGILYQKTDSDGDEDDWTNGQVAAPIEVADIANLAVETAKINDLAVTAAKIASDAVETAKIKNLNVTPAKLSVVPFVRTAQLTAAAAATPVEVLAAADVGAGRKAFVTGMLLNVGGATAWSDATGTVVALQDTADTPVNLLSAAKAQLTANANLGLLSTGVTLGAPILTGVGATAAKGIDIVADDDFTAGSTINVTVFGFISA